VFITQICQLQENIILAVLRMTNGSTATAAVAAAANEEEVWSRDDHDWALTYNIWHMLPWMERKDMASKYGCKTIGEFEEYMSIRRALGSRKEAIFE
jgi:hypothetical protein